MRGRRADLTGVRTGELDERADASLSVEPFRLTGLPAVGLALAAVNAIWLTVGLVRPVPAAPGWAAVLLACLPAALMCRRVGLAPGIHPGAARFWRSIGVVCLVIGAAGAANAYDMLSAPVPTLRVRPDTTVLYLGGLLAALWALVRIPGVRRPPAEWLRFGLDTATVVVGCGLVAWQVSLRHLNGWQDAPGGFWTLIGTAVLALTCVLAFIKVAFSGTGPLDRHALYAIAMAGTFGAVIGAASPLLASRPYLSGAQFSVPVVMAVVLLAADRQRRAAAVRPHRRVRRHHFSRLSYLAVLTTDAVLLWVTAGASAPVVGAAIGVVILTALVVLRQVTAFTDNARLLADLDGKLHELRGYQERLAHQASHDALTQLVNRQVFEQRTRDALAGAHAAVSVALVDLDDFKAVNDSLGHTVGDALLVAVAARLEAAVAGDGMVARLGGDEFALLLTGDDPERHVGILDRLVREFGHPLAVTGRDLLVHASIGLAEAEPGTTAQELLRRADVAMYAAKNTGKARYARYRHQFDQDSAEQARLVADLRVALRTGQLFLVYQPIVALADGRVAGVEALVRWRHPERGMVRPDQFISAAERTGLIVPVGEWILTEACRQAVAWQRALGGLAPGRISVNVSARQLCEPGFAELVGDVLARTGLAPGRLVVEVTETAVFDGGAALDALHAIKGLGVSVALDDFGTGHSSLGLLRTCPVDVLKVDRLFVEGIAEGGEQSVIAAALIQISAGLKLAAVAEGVETEEQARRLRGLGYRYAQGYLFARPMPAAEITELLRAAEADLGTAGLAPPDMTSPEVAANV